MMLNGSAVKTCVEKKQSLIVWHPSTTGAGSTSTAWDIVHETWSCRVSAIQPECGQNVGGHGGLLDPWHVRIGRVRLLGASVARVDHERDASSPQFQSDFVAWPISQFGVQNGHVRVQVSERLQHG